jgi:glucosyl-3-phosphoglycerate synthase
LIAVIIPALNEERTVAEVIGRVPASVGELPTRVVVIDDGSADRTGRSPAGPVPRIARGG